MPGRKLIRLDKQSYCKNYSDSYFSPDRNVFCGKLTKQPFPSGTGQVEKHAGNGYAEYVTTNVISTTVQLKNNQKMAIADDMMNDQMITEAERYKRVYFLFG